MLVIFTLAGCSLPPKPLGNGAQSQQVRKNLICAKQIDIQLVSINGAKPPKSSFDLSINQLKKYTTDNVLIHDTINLTIEKDNINLFIHAFGSKRDMPHLTTIDRKLLQNTLQALPTHGSTIIMIYTPALQPDLYDDKPSRGIAFYNSHDFRVVAYNQSTINKAPVISKTQAWKIVLTHELGHQFGVPAARTHNKEGHCTRRECVMYSSPDWQSVVSVLLHGMPYDFCSICKAELQKAKQECNFPSPSR